MFVSFKKTLALVALNDRKYVWNIKFNIGVSIGGILNDVGKPSKASAKVSL